MNERLEMTGRNTPCPAACLDKKMAASQARILRYDTEMKDLDTAAQALSLEAKWLQEFDVVDPFNGTALRGFLARKPDHRYGALAVTRVNGEPAPQLVFATPKLHYPFDRQGRFNFPPVREVEIFEKYDGTNVLAYAYHDAHSHAYCDAHSH